MSDEINMEIENLKSRRVEISTKINMTKDDDEKEELKKELEILQRQIDTLEKFYKKSI